MKKKRGTKGVIATIMEEGKYTPVITTTIAGGFELMLQSVAGRKTTKPQPVIGISGANFFKKIYDLAEEEKPGTGKDAIINMLKAGWKYAEFAGVDASESEKFFELIGIKFY